MSTPAAPNTATAATITANVGPNVPLPSLSDAELYEVKVRVAAAFLRLSDLKAAVLEASSPARKGALDALVRQVVSTSLSCWLHSSN
jgi:hypothetical protein